MYEYPERYEKHFTMKNKEFIFIRPLKTSDRPLIVDLFDNLSESTRYFRFLMNLHSFPNDLLDRLMDIDYDSSFALAGIVNENGEDAVVAVARYSFSPAGSYTDLGVTVRDDFQNLGLGRHLLKSITDIGREHGYRRFRCMIDPKNKVILHLLAAFDAHFVLKDKVYYVEIIV